MREPHRGRQPLRIHMPGLHSKLSAGATHHEALWERRGCQRPDGGVELNAGAGGRSWQQAAGEGPPHIAASIDTYNIPGIAVSGTLAAPMVTVPSPCMRLQGAVGKLSSLPTLGQFNLWPGAHTRP